MVEVLPSPTFGQELSADSVDMKEISDRFMSANMNTHGSSGEQPSAAGTVRNPRRAFSSTDQPPATASISKALRTQERLITPAQTPREPAQVDSYFQIPPNGAGGATPAAAAVTPRNLVATAAAAAAAAVQPPRGNGGAGHTPAWAGRRPVLPGPQRSYSLMDVEPVPFTHQPGVDLTLPELPPELHYLLFNFLDPIDSTCLALTSKHFYTIHRHMHGTVPLGARREGPNDMEWVWRNAGPFIVAPRLSQAAGSRKNEKNGYGDDVGLCGQNALAGLSPRGQVYCRKCATSRCELHNHIRDWMGPGMEYCEVRQKFGPGAPEGADAVCRRSSPRHPQRCSRHTRQQRTIRLT